MRNERLLATTTVAGLLLLALSGCNESDRGPYVWFEVEFTNDTRNSFVSYEISGYGRRWPDDPPGEVGNNSHARGVRIGPDGSLPGKHAQDDAYLPVWSIYSFEAYLGGDGTGFNEFREFPVDATQCPHIKPGEPRDPDTGRVVFSVRAFDSLPGQVAYDYNLNCP